MPCELGLPGSTTVGMCRTTLSHRCGTSIISYSKCSLYLNIRISRRPRKGLLLIVSKQSSVTVSSASAPVTITPATYKVQRGDTLWGISQKHGVTVIEMRDANNMDRKSSVIREGQLLRLPPNAQTLQETAKQQAVQQQPPAQQNSLPSLPDFSHLGNWVQQKGSAVSRRLSSLRQPAQEVKGGSNVVKAVSAPRPKAAISPIASSSLEHQKAMQAPAKGKLKQKQVRPCGMVSDRFQKKPSSLMGFKHKPSFTKIRTCIESLDCKGSSSTALGLTGERERKGLL